MSYNPLIIFPPNEKSIIVKKDVPVDLYVVRTNLFGSEILGNRGLYHAGLLFESENISWVIDLSIEGNMGAMIPYLTNDGEVEVNNPIVLEYYSPETIDSWRDYWNIKSDKICTISPYVYDKLLDYIMKTLGPKYDRYIPFSITNKPFYTVNGEQDKIVSIIYASDNTCDKFPMRCFEWLHKNHSIDIKPFPITHMVLTVNQKPIPITDMKDPGLVSYTKKMQNYIESFKKINSKDPASLIDIYKYYSSKKEDNDINTLEYVLSLDNLTQKPQWYKLPIDDVAISVQDMYFKIINKSNYTLIIVLAVLLAILLFIVFKKIGKKELFKPLYV